MRLRTPLLPLLLLAVLFACAAEVATSSTKAKGDAPAPSASASAEASARPAYVFQESDFVERDDNRDPFRSYESLFQKTDEPTDKPQRRVRLADFSLEQLTLIAIVRNASPSVAMVTDPSGTGHVIRQGEFIGRAESVRTGSGGVVYDVNWRVDQIRDGDVVFVRQDPANPDTPAATRVLLLRDETRTLNNLAEGEDAALGPSQAVLDSLNRGQPSPPPVPADPRVPAAPPGK